MLTFVIYTLYKEHSSYDEFVYRAVSKDSVFVEMKFLARFVFLDAIPCGKICSRGILISPVGSGQFLH